MTFRHPEPVEGAGQTLVWNEENLLEEIRDATSPYDTIESYVYDGDKQRAVKVDSDGNTTLYVNKWYEVELDSSGDVIRDTVSYWLGGQLIATREGGGLKFMHTDSLGSSSVATDLTGAAVAGNTYYPYGEHRSSTGAFGTDRDFTGQRLDATGLHYYNARYYDSALGRFVSPDTVVPNRKDPRSLNRYSYVLSNPLRHFDPTGHGCDTTDCWADPSAEQRKTAKPRSHSSDRCDTTDCWSDPKPHTWSPSADYGTNPDRKGPQVDEYIIGGSLLVTVETIPVVSFVNIERADGQGNLLPTDDGIVTVPYSVANGSAGSAMQTINGALPGNDSETDSYSNPGSSNIIIQANDLYDPGIWTEEVFHKVEQNNYFPVASHAIWTLNYVLNSFHGEGNNRFEERARSAARYARLPSSNVTYTFSYMYRVSWTILPY